jgi:hypothetical protein
LGAGCGHGPPGGVVTHRMPYALADVTMLPMRPSSEEETSTPVCHDTDSCTTLRTGVHRMALAAPVDAHAWPEVDTGLSARLSSPLLGAVDGHAVG